MTKTACLPLILGLMAVAPLHAQEAAVLTRAEWGNLAALAPDQRVGIHLQTLRAGVGGKYISHTAESVTVKTGKSRYQTYSRVEVKRIRPRSSWAGRGALLGLFAGIGWLLVENLSHNPHNYKTVEDWHGEWRRQSFSHVAPRALGPIAGGFLVGFCVDRLRKPVYEAPESRR